MHLSMIVINCSRLFLHHFVCTSEDNVFDFLHYKKRYSHDKYSELHVRDGINSTLVYFLACLYFGSFDYCIVSYLCDIKYNQRFPFFHFFF